ncbi:AfsR/SARP family transcriptional regulator [Actinoplanes sp. NPDC004185]
MRFAALSDRIDAELAAGRHSTLAAELYQLTEEHPLRERLRGQLMMALDRDGRRADALEVYRRTRQVLIAELDPGRRDQLHVLGGGRSHQHTGVRPRQPPPDETGHGCADDVADGRGAARRDADQTVLRRPVPTPSEQWERGEAGEHRAAGQGVQAHHLHKSSSNLGRWCTGRWEIPALPARPTQTPIPFPVPDGVTNGRKSRTAWRSRVAAARSPCGRRHSRAPRIGSRACFEPKFPMCIRAGFGEGFPCNAFEYSVSA